MPESFGARLRQRREEQQIALSTIAEQTKIKQSILDALERDDVSQWPAGIFRRAFIRAYAHAIGLEPDVVVREFLEVHPDPVEEVEMFAATVSGGDGAGGNGGPPTRLRNIVGSAIGSLSRLRARSPQRATSILGDGVVASRGPIESPPVSADDLQPAPPVDFDHADDMPAPAGDLLEVTPAAAMPASTEARQAIETSASAPPMSAEPPQPDLFAVAHLCTELGRVDRTSDVAPLLQEAARILDAVGIVVWISDPDATELFPALAHGYSDHVLAQLPRVGRDTNNATAAAFRSAQTCIVNSSGLVSGALVIPLLTPVGCEGVLAIELQHGREEREPVRALATIFAAQLATLIGAARPAEASGRRLA